MRGEMGFTAAEHRAMTRALELARTPGVPLGPNPRVGCVLLDDKGSPVAEGFHRGAGSRHAEADALARAGGSARGSTAARAAARAPPARPAAPRPPPPPPPPPRARRPRGPPRRPRPARPPPPPRGPAPPPGPRRGPAGRGGARGRARGHTAAGAG